MGLTTNRIEVSEDVLLPGGNSVKEHIENDIIHLSIEDREQIGKVIGGVDPLFPDMQFGEGYPTASVTAIRVANPAEHLPERFKEIVFKNVQNTRTATDTQVLVVQFEVGGHVVTDAIAVSNRVTAAWNKGDDIHYVFEKAVEVKPEYDNVIIYVQWSNVAEANPETATSTIVEANVPHLYYDNSSTSVSWFSTRTSTNSPWNGAWAYKARPIEFVAVSKFDILQEKVDAIQQGGGSGEGDGNVTIDPDEIITVKGVKVTGGDSSETGIDLSASFDGNLDLGKYAKLSGGTQYGIVNLGKYGTISSGTQLGNVNLGYFATISSGAQEGNVNLGNSARIVGGDQFGNVTLGSSAVIAGNLYITRNTWIIGSLNSTINFESQVTTRYGLTLIGTGRNTPSTSNDFRYQVYWPNSEDYPAQIHGWQEWRPDYNVKDADGNLVIQDGKLVGGTSVPGEGGCSADCGGINKVTKLFPTTNFAAASTTSALNGIRIDNPYLHAPEYFDEIVFRNVQNERTGDHAQQVLVIHFSVQGQDIVQEATVVSHHTIGLWNVGDDIHFAFDKTVHVKPEYTRMMIYLTWKTNADSNPNAVPGTLQEQYCPSVKYDASSANLAWFDTRTSTAAPWTGEWKNKPRDIAFVTKDINAVIAVDNEQLKEVLAEVVGTNVISLGEEPDSNVNCQSIELTEVHIPTDFNVSSIMLHARVNNTVPTTDPLYLSVWEQVENNGDNYRLLAVSNNTQVQAVNTWSEWMFEGLKLNGKKIRIACIATPETSFSDNSMIGISCQSREAGDTCIIHTKTGPVNYHPTMRIKGTGTLPYAPISHVGDPTHITAAERTKWDGYQTSINNKVNSATFSSHTANTTMHLTADEHNKLTQLLTNGGTGSGGGEGGTTIDPNEILKVKGIEVAGGTDFYRSDGINWSDMFDGNLDLGAYAELSGGNQYGTVNLGRHSIISGGDQYGNVLLGENSTIQGGVQYCNLFTGTGLNIIGNKATSYNTWILGGWAQGSKFESQITTRYGLTLIGTGIFTPSVSNSYRYQVYWPSSTAWSALIHGYKQWSSDYNVQDASGNYVVLNGKFVFQREATIDSAAFITIRGIKVTGSTDYYRSDSIDWAEEFDGNLDLGAYAGISGGNQRGNITLGYNSTISYGSQYGNIVAGLNTAISGGEQYGTINLGQMAAISGGEQYGTINSGQSTTITNGYQHGNIILGQGSTIESGYQYGNIILGRDSTISGGRQDGNVFAGSSFNVNVPTTRNTWIIADLADSVNFKQQVPTRYGLTLIGTGNNTPSTASSSHYQVYWPDSGNYPAQIHGWKQWNSDFNVKDASGNLVIREGKLVQQKEVDINPDEIIIVKGIQVAGGSGLYAADGILWNTDTENGLDLGKVARVEGGTIYGNINLGVSSTVSGGYLHGNIFAGYAVGIAGGNITGNIILGQSAHITIGGLSGNVILGTDAQLTGNTHLTNNTWIIAGMDSNSPSFESQITTRYGLTLIGTGTNTPTAANSDRYQVYWPDSSDYPAQIHGWQEWRSDYNVKDAEGNLVVQNGKSTSPRIVICNSEDELPAPQDQKPGVLYCIPETE